MDGGGAKEGGEEEETKSEDSLAEDLMPFKLTPAWMPPCARALWEDAAGRNVNKRNKDVCCEKSALFFN